MTKDTSKATVKGQFTSITVNYIVLYFLIISSRGWGSELAGGWKLQKTVYFGVRIHGGRNI